MRCWRPSHPWPLCVDWDRVCNRRTEGRARDGYGWEMSTLLSLPAPPPSRVREGQSGHQTGPRCPQTGSRQTQHEPRQAQEPIYNGGGGATPHGIYNCQEPPKSLPEQPKRRPNVARAAAGAAGVARAAAGRKGAELCPQPLARGRAGGSSWQTGNSVCGEPPWS